MDENIVTQKTITDRWLDNLFESLMRLEQYERLAREGCVSLLEYVQNPNIDLALIQNKNYGLFMTEFNITLRSGKRLIEKNTYLDLLLEYKTILKIELNTKGFLSEEIDEISHTRKNTLKPSFYKILNKLSSLRARLVDSLWFVLSPKAKDTLPG
jgi:hypothetical protein